tara:strand:- start:2148 stop:2591 length:444 start_codon:yes stop_codon:yes gene_type:complete
MENSTQTQIQAKVFDFALAQLVIDNRSTFQPLWTVDSWVKFLIWMSLNCGFGGEQKSIELFVDSLGSPITSLMRRIFFERLDEDLSLKIMADPAEDQVIVFQISQESCFSLDHVSKSLEMVGLKDHIVPDKSKWKLVDNLVAIPWAR